MSRIAIPSTFHLILQENRAALYLSCASCSGPAPAFLQCADPVSAESWSSCLCLNTSGEKEVSIFGATCYIARSQTPADHSALHSLETVGQAGVVDSACLLRSSPEDVNSPSISVTPRSTTDRDLVSLSGVLGSDSCKRQKSHEVATWDPVEPERESSKRTGSDWAPHDPCHK